MRFVVTENRPAAALHFPKPLKVSSEEITPDQRDYFISRRETSQRGHIIGQIVLSQVVRSIAVVDEDVKLCAGFSSKRSLDALDRA